MNTDITKFRVGQRVRILEMSTIARPALRKYEGTTGTVISMHGTRLYVMPDRVLDDLDTSYIEAVPRGLMVLSAQLFVGVPMLEYAP